MIGIFILLCTMFIINMVMLCMIKDIFDEIKVEKGAHKPMKTFYELMLDIEKNQAKQQKINDQILSNQDDADRVKADILLNQAKIMKTQEAQDEAIANILLNQMAGVKDGTQ